MGNVAILFLYSLSACVVSVGAEMRLWTDSEGDTIEAEHVRTLGDSVVLRQKDDAEIKVSLDALSERDRKYALLLAPVRIDITVSPKTNRKNKGYGAGHGGGFQVQEESIVAEVGIRKSSSAPYEAPLVAEICLIGKAEQHDGYIVLDHGTSKFRFSADNKNEHAFSSGIINLTQFEGGVQKGVEYEGYLVVVKNLEGEVISFKCNKLEFEKNAAAIMGAAKGSLFDGDFNPVDREALRRDGAIPEKRDKRRLPGRRF